MLWRLQRVWGSFARGFLRRYLAVITPRGSSLSPAQIRRYVRRRELVRRVLLRHELQISSFGGAGTSLLCSWLGRHPGLPTPRFIGDDWAPWKHMRQPPPDAAVGASFRAVYVLSDPRDAVASVFRRNYQHGHVQRLQGDMASWNFTCGLADYLAQGEDLYQLSDHVQNWVGANRSYPILVLRYETLWENLDALGRFVSLTPEQMSRFPARIERATDWRNEASEIRDGLDAIYGPLAATVAALPDAFVLQNGERREP